MDKVKTLVDVLQKLNENENDKSAREEALKLVSNITPLELSMAEQQLIENGLHPEDLRGLCEVHMEVLENELEGLRAQVKPGHVLSTLISEHDEILKLLSVLDGLNNRIQKMESFDEKVEDFKLLLETAELILEAENHHQREEQVLFPELEKRHVTGPTRIMRMEHEDLRAKKRLIRQLAKDVENMDFNDFKSQLDSAAKYLVFNMRDHIFKENHILYPTAINVISDEVIWNDLKKNCDKIGYCPFTPESERQ